MYCIIIILILLQLFTFVYIIIKRKRLKESIQFTRKQIIFFKEWIKMFSQNYGFEGIARYRNKRVAIVGMDDIGEAVYYMFKNKKINITYFVDKQADSIYYGVDDLEVYEISQISIQNVPDVFILCDNGLEGELNRHIHDNGLVCDVVKISNCIYCS